VEAIAPVLIWFYTQLKSHMSWAHLTTAEKHIPYWGNGTKLITKKKNLN
jgi:hypothetical protein